MPRRLPLYMAHADALYVASGASALGRKRTFLSFDGQRISLAARQRPLLRVLGRLIGTLILAGPTSYPLFLGAD